MADQDTSVLLDVTDGVALVTLNRPERRNALTGSMTDRYFSVMEQCNRDPAVRAIVVTGAGRGFCVGSDVEHLDAVLADPTKATISVGARSFVDVTAMPKPVIAAINGACAGLGLVIAMSCDLRFAAADAKLTTSFSRRGLVAEQGLAWLLPRVVGVGAAMDLLLSGRVISGTEGQEMGLVNRTVEGATLLDVTVAYARDLAENCSPASMAGIKGQVWAGTSGSLGDALDESRQLLQTSIAGPDFAEGVASYREGRPPAFPALAWTED